MSTENGKKALQGLQVWVEGELFQIKENMTMTFEGGSCFIQDGEGNAVDNFYKDDGVVVKEVLEGYRCYVMKAHIMFKKK
jgi:hypothetical protein